MPNELPEQGPASHDPVARTQGPAVGRRVAPWLVGGAALLALVAVLLGSVIGRPPAPADIAAAASSIPLATVTASPTATGGTPGTSAGSAGGSGAPAGPTAAAGSPVVPQGSGQPPPASSPAAPSGSGTPPPGGSAGPGATADGALAAKLQRTVDKLRASLRIPGVSVAIVWDDGRTWTGASGWANVKDKVPMTTGTAFAFASVSKTLTAAVILQLVQEGRLSLDDRVAGILPQFGLHPAMTIRQLLDHTSGLPDYFLNAKIDKPLQAAPGATWTADRTWTYVQPKHPDPGNLWIYSNANYLLLGKVVEEVTGHPLAEEIRARLLDPIGLATAWYQVAEEPRAPGATGYRIVRKSGGAVRFVPVGPESDIMPFRSVVTAADGAGSIAGTALDAARWMQAYAGGDVVSAATRRLQVADAKATLKLGARIPYGLGIQATPILGHKALGHSGRFLGFRNEVRYFPKDGFAIAVLTNQSTWDPGRFERAILKIIAPKPAPSASPGAAGSSQATATASP